MKTKTGDWPKVDWRTYGCAVIGVDEVGRGCLAGPVAAAACLFLGGELEPEMTDSKKLTPRRREQLSARIHAAFPCAIATADAREIEELNILQASLLAMKRAVDALMESLRAGPHSALADEAVVVIDGIWTIPDLGAVPQRTLVKGDLRCAPVSAASIIAKVWRDQWMREQEVLFPGYGFVEHKGYATATHRAALARLGPCVLHRRSFGGVKELVVDL